MRLAPHRPLALFTSYVSADEGLRTKLDNHLAILKQHDVLRDFDHAQVGPGREWDADIANKITRADVILLLLSSDYLSSKQCYATELGRAMERHARGTAIVIPIILRPCDWKETDLAKLRPLPDEGRAVTKWPDPDEAFLNVVLGIRAAIDQIGSGGVTVNRDECEARHPDPMKMLLDRELENASNRRKILLDNGMKAEADLVTAEIIELKRRSREGIRLHVGDRLDNGRFILQAEVGRGGFGTVWRAHDCEQDRSVAVKVMHPHLINDSIRYERFFRGARKMVELDHRAVVRVIEKEGHEGIFHYFVMDFLPRGDLRRAVRDNAFPAEQVVPLILEVGDVLASAHRLGIVHRDVKPSNILLNNLGEPRLTDFDLVSAPDTTGGTATGALGSWIYSPPEMLDRPQEADARADVYGLGMTAVFCINRAELPSAVIEDRGRFLRKLVPDEALRGVLRRAIELKRSKRFADAHEFCEALRAACYPPLFSEGVAGEVPQRADELHQRLQAAQGDPDEEDRVLREIQERARRRHGII